MEYHDHLKELSNIIYNKSHCQHGMDNDELIAIDKALHNLYYSFRDKTIEEQDKQIIALNESVLMLNYKKSEARLLLEEVNSCGADSSFLRDKIRIFLQRNS